MSNTKHTHESGYAMLSLLVGMTIGLVVLASMLSKPTTQFTNQRENEEEMFFRAQNVSAAILKYVEVKGGGLAPQNLPTKLEDLLSEFNMQGRTIHLIRKSSLVDPMTGKDWKPVRLGDPLIGQFLRAYQKAMLEQQAAALTAGPAAAAQQQQMQQQMQFLLWAAQNSGVNVTNLNEKDEEGKEDEGKGLASGFTLGGDSDSRPIVGVVSTFKKPLIREYFGIATYDKALMVPGIQTPLMRMGMGVPGGGIGGPGAAPGTPTEPVPDTAPKLQGGRCPPGSTDPTCPRNMVPIPPQ